MYSRKVYICINVDAVAENCMTVLGIVVKEEDGGNGSVSEEKKDKESVYVRQIDV